MAEKINESRRNHTIIPVELNKKYQIGYGYGGGGGGSW